MTTEEIWEKLPAYIIVNGIECDFVVFKNGPERRIAYKPVDERVSGRFGNQSFAFLIEDAPTFKKLFYRMYCELKKAGYDFSRPSEKQSLEVKFP